eukprot:NODE_431_length_7570_cov_0.606263.p2 type:complete len:333 gc:universal NODE_431_length_7570_cov_0.606263:914-1912(+)
MIKIMSYNILSPQIASKMSYMYKNCILENRFPRIIDKILKMNPDVLFLQEVELDQFTHLKSILSDYYGDYQQRLSNPDGCATFIKHHLKLKYFKPILLNIPNSISNRNNVCLLHLIECNHELLVLANTHILYNPKRGYIKASQIIQINNEIFNLMDQFNCKSSPILFGGDFNLSPSSALYELITNGHVNLQMIPEHQLSNQLSTPKSSLSTSLTIPCIIPDDLYLPFIYKSAYLDQHDYFTQDLKSKNGFHGLFVDFIFYGHLNKDYKPVRVDGMYQSLSSELEWNEPHETVKSLKCVKIGELTHPSACVSMPHQNEPSDHFSVYAEFVFNQ